MTESQMGILAQWVLIGLVWVQMGIYTIAAIRESAYERRVDLRQVMPVRPARCLVAMVTMDAIGHRPWWKTAGRAEVLLYRHMQERGRGLVQ